VRALAGLRVSDAARTIRGPSSHSGRTRDSQPAAAWQRFLPTGAPGSCSLRVQGPGVRSQDRRMSYHTLGTPRGDSASCPRTPSADAVADGEFRMSKFPAYSSGFLRQGLSTPSPQRSSQGPSDTLGRSSGRPRGFPGPHPSGQPGGALPPRGHPRRCLRCPSPGPALTPAGEVLHRPLAPALIGNAPHSVHPLGGAGGRPGVRRRRRAGGRHRGHPQGERTLQG